MQRIEVLVEGRELVLLMTPEEMGPYVNQRRQVLIGKSRKAFCEAFDIPSSVATGLLNGKRLFGPKYIGRLNEIDREYEAVALIGIVRRKGTKLTDLMVIETK